MPVGFKPLDTFSSLCLLPWTHHATLGHFVPMIPDGRQEALSDNLPSAQLFLVTQPLSRLGVPAHLQLAQMGVLPPLTSLRGSCHCRSLAGLPARLQDQLREENEQP